MSAGDSPMVGLPTEFRSALEHLHRLFAGALHDAKFDSCHWAWHGIKRTKTAKKKIELLNEKFEQWREGGANAIREWLPEFVNLAMRNPEVIGDDPIHWARDSVWETVEAMFGIQRPLMANHSPSIRAVNDITIWWFAVASEGKPDVNVPPLRSWSAPRWLARDRRGTEELLEKYTEYLWLRVNRVIEDEIALAEIRRAGNRKGVEQKIEPLEAEVGGPKEKEPIFSASEDYRSIRYKGATYTLTRNQATITRMLHEAYLKGTPTLGKNALLAAIEAETSRVRDSFKVSPLWGTLIVQNRKPRGTYQLDLK
jgi:hypothetical protein